MAKKQPKRPDGLTVAMAAVEAGAGKKFSKPEREAFVLGFLVGSLLEK